MSFITAKDGAQIYYKDWGAGQPIVFSHGWPLTADAWEDQMFFLASNGYRCIAHDRRGHGRSSQSWEGNDMDTYADDLAALTEALDLKDAIHIGHSTGGGEVARYIGRHGTKRVAKAVLISAVPPGLLKTAANPGGMAIEIFDGLRGAIAADRANFWKVFCESFYGYNRPGAKASDGVRDSFWLQSTMAGFPASYLCIKAFSETDFTEDLKKFDVPDADPAWQRRPGRAGRRDGEAHGEDGPGRDPEDLRGRAARDVHDVEGSGQRGPAGVHRDEAGTKSREAQGRQS